MMGDSAPQTPRDLALFFSRMDVFCFSGLRSCRTLERLDRKTGQRRDATRAPIQARNGWRPSGRFLVTPPHHLRKGKILSNLWGPPQRPGTMYSLVIISIPGENACRCVKSRNHAEF